MEEENIKAADAERCDWIRNWSSGAGYLYPLRQLQGELRNFSLAC